MAGRLALFPIHISFFPLSVSHRTYTALLLAQHVQKSLKGCKWTNNNKSEDQRYRLNAYRGLLTRARQGMAIVYLTVHGKTLRDFRLTMTQVGIIS